MWDQSLLSWLLKFIRGTKSKFFLKLPPYYKGVVKNKIEIMHDYKFCLVVENMSEISFVTEKVFHALELGLSLIHI